MAEDEPLTPLEQAVLTGELFCPIRQGIVAMEACVNLQLERGARCMDLGCGFFHYRQTFDRELRKARGEKTAKKEPAKRNPVGRPRRVPGRRPWQE